MGIQKAFIGLSLFGLAVSIWGQAGGPRLVQLQKSPPEEMLQSTSLGAKPESDVLHLTVSLPSADPDGLRQLADAVSDPKSPSYRQFINPEEVGQRFGLPTYRVQRIRDYLVSQGMKIRLVGKNRLSMIADATVAQVQAAFHTTIENFQAPDSATRFSFTTAPMLPANFAQDVIDVEGLESFTRPTSFTPLSASQLRTLYSASTIYTSSTQGKGRTIGISSYDGYGLSNVPLECKLMSLPTPTAGAGSNITVESVAGGSGSTGTPTGEGDLDIQAALCMAPLSTIIVYDNFPASKSGAENPIAVLTQEADDNTADIITESYGWSMGASSNLAAHNIHLSMTAQGITYMAASGDHGTTWVQKGTNFDYPAIEPEVLLVGGTSVTVNTSGGRLSEVGWNSGGDAGGGGWVSTTDSFNTRPSYQSTSTFLAGAGVPSIAKVPYRLIPDVSFDADPNTGYVIYFEGKEVQIGGTSASSPTCAGLFADLEAQLIEDGELKANSAGKYRMGRVQDLLYSLNGNSKVFFDVTSGTNGTLPNGKVSEAVVGWDTDSGWGPIIFSGLLNQIEKGVASVVISPATILGGSSSTGTVTVTSAAPAGGTVLTLTSSSSSAKVPPTVTIASGMTTAKFTIDTSGVAASTSVTISAAIGSNKASTTLTISPAALAGFSLSSKSVIGGSTSAVNGTVTLNGPAGPSGTVVTVASSTTAAATVPATVTVPAGATTFSFAVNHLLVTAVKSATIKATLGKASQSAVLTVNPFQVTGLSLSPTSVTGGTSSTGTVTFNATASAKTGAIGVKLASSSKSATVGATVSVPAGASSATFKITTKSVTTNTSSTITATLGSSSKTATLTIES